MLIVLNIFLVMQGVAQERKEKTMLFILSLPVSAMDYTMAKVMATGIAFGVPWLVLTAATAITIVVSPIPDGVLPCWMTLLGYLLAYFCALLGIALLKRFRRLARRGDHHRQRLGQLSDSDPAVASVRVAVCRWPGRGVERRPRRHSRRGIADRTRRARLRRLRTRTPARLREPLDLLDRLALFR